MPTGREVVPNKALSGSELKKIIKQDFEQLLANHGLLSDYLSYGRVGYDVTLRMHMDNPMRPEDSTTISSRPVATNLIAENPALAAIETPPLKEPSKNSAVDGRRVSRKVTSPNAERMRAGLPVPIQRKQHDGSLVTENITYPTDSSIPDNSETADVSAEARADWKVTA